MRPPRSAVRAFGLCLLLPLDWPTIQSRHLCKQRVSASVEPLCDETKFSITRSDTFHLAARVREQRYENQPRLRSPATLAFLRQALLAAEAADFRLPCLSPSAFPW